MRLAFVSAPGGAVAVARRNILRRIEIAFFGYRRAGSRDCARVGWGLAGICPGPALADRMTLEPKVLVFVAAMLIGTVVNNVWRDKMRPTNAVR